MEGNNPGLIAASDSRLSEDDCSQARQPLLPPADTDTDEQRQSSSALSEGRLQLCMVLGCGAVYAARTVIPLVIPDVAAELGWSSVLVGYVLSFFFWGYALTQVIGGHLADRVGGARVIVATQAVGAASLLMFPALVVVWPASAVLLRCLLGVVQGPHYPALGSVCGQLVPAARRARFLSTCLLGSPLGTVLVALVGSALLQRLGWRLVVTLTGLLYAGCGLWLYRLTRHCAVPARRPATTSGAGGVPWKGLFTSRAVWACVLIHMTHTTTWFILISWLPSYFKQAHPEAQPWLVNTLPFAFNAAGTLASSRVAEWLQRRQLSLTAVRRTVEVGSQLTGALALFILPAVSGTAAAVSLASIAAFSAALHAGGGLLLPQDLCPEHVGSLFGVMNTGGALAGALSNLAAGHLLERFGNFSAVFHMAALASLGGSIMFGTIGSADRLQF